MDKILNSDKKMLNLNLKQKDISKLHCEYLEGKYGFATQKAAEILQGIAKVYHTDAFIPVTSVQISGVSYMNLGEAGLNFIRKLSSSGKVKIKTTLNPSAVDYESPQEFLDKTFISKQKEVIDAYISLGVTPTLSCTPYFVGNSPTLGEHIAWAESSAVVYANSVLGAMTNREGGPSALASALTGYTPYYGLHLIKNRIPKIKIYIDFQLQDPLHWGLLGAWIGKNFGSKIPLICSVKKQPTTRDLQAISASIATYGGASIFYIDDFTYKPPDFDVKLETFHFKHKDLENILNFISDPADLKPDLVFMGCPHLSKSDLLEISNEYTCTNKLRFQLATAGNSEFSRKNKNITILKGTCIAVSPLEKDVKTIVTDSIKAAFYLKNRGYNVVCKTTKECLKCI